MKMGIVCTSLILNAEQTGTLKKKIADMLLDILWTPPKDMSMNPHWGNTGSVKRQMYKHSSRMNTVLYWSHV